MDPPPSCHHPSDWLELFSSQNFSRVNISAFSTPVIHTLWIDGFLYKLTLLIFPSYIVHTISSYLRDRTFEASFQAVTSSCRGMLAGVAQCGLISPVLFSLYVNEMPSPSRHVELAFYCHHSHVQQAGRRCPSATCSHNSTIYNGGQVNGESPLMYLKAML